MRTSICTSTATARTNRDLGDPPSTAESPADPTTDTGLRATLSSLVAEHRFTGSPEWEAIGAHLLLLAERDAWRGHHHAAEFTGAYVAAGVELLRRHPDAVLSARSPWGLVVTKARHAGQHAVGAEATCGLTDRDPQTHHVRFANVPRVVSLDGIVEGRMTLAAG